MLVTFCVTCFVSTTFALTSEDIGGPSIAGSYSESGGTHTIQASGSDIWNSSDEFRYSYVPMTGDGEAIARVQSIGYVHQYSKGGVMMRETLAANSKHATTLVHANGLIAFQRRTSTGASTVYTNGGNALPTWVRIVRSGDTFTSYSSSNGTSWTQIGSSVTISMSSTIYVGLALTSHDNSSLTTGVFTNVSLPGPAESVLFSEDFNDGNANGWTTSGGSWSVNSNEYLNTGSGWSLAGDTSWDDYSIQGDVYAIESTYPGIYGRVTDTNNAYHLEINVPNQQVQLWKRVSGTWTQLDNYSTTINQNTWYTLKLTMSGSSLIGYLNGNEVVSATDTSFSSGKIGLRSGNDARFDNIIVTEPGSAGDTTAPSVPTGLASSNITSSSVNLSWNASSDNSGGTGVAGYLVYTGGSNPIDVTSGTSVMISNLDPGTAYSFTVSAYDGASNESSQSSSLGVTTTAGPIISEDFSVDAANFSVDSGGTWGVSNGALVLTSPATGSTPGILGNIVVHDTSVTGDYVVTAVMNITGTASAWNDAAIVFGYQNSSNYYYVSLNESNDGYTKGIFKVVSGTPTQLADISISVASDTNYPIEIQRVGTSIVAKVNGSQVASTTDSTFSGGLVGFGTYNDGAAFDNLIVTGDPDNTAPSTPSGLTASNVAETTVDLDWNAASDNVGVAGYKIYTSGSNPTVVGNYTGVTLEQLSPSTTYSFTVSAYDAAGNESSQSSPPVSVTTSSATAQVAAPQFSPGGGNYSSAQSVSITTSTSGATIRYTTNGSNPTASSGTIYTGSITISSTTTLKAIAYKSGMYDSTVSSASYVIGTAPLYGPRGAWPSDTPAHDATPTATLSSLAALQTALQTANPGDVFHLTSFTQSTDFILNNATAQANLASFGPNDQNVLVRAAPGAIVSFNAGFQSFIPNITWAYLKVNGFFALRKSSDHSRMARIQLGAESLLAITSSGDHELVEVVKRDRGTNGDVMSTQSVPSGPAPYDILYDSCWFEGNSITQPGEHSDTLQWTAATGTIKLRNTYLGPCGNNATMQQGTETQPSGVPYAVFDLDTVFLGGAILYGNGNVFGNGHTNSIFRRVEWPQVKSRAETLPPAVAEYCRFDAADPKMADGTTSISSLYPNNEFGVSVPFPTFIEPDWWD